MNLFTQLVPRLSRAVARSDDAATTANEAEFTLKPAYQLKESADAWGLTVQLPGVAKEGLDLTVEDGLIRIRGRRSWKQPEGWTAVYRESVDAGFALDLTHDNSVNADKIVAELKDGVLRVSLPKAESIKPRKVAIN
jgi:HSP20 family molecular chaperone IbpA